VLFDRNVCNILTGFQDAAYWLLQRPPKSVQLQKLREDVSVSLYAIIEGRKFTIRDGNWKLRGFHSESLAGLAYREPRVAA
jgi:hypothetical protein